LSEPLVNYIGIDVCSESWEGSDLKKNKMWFSIHPESCSSAWHHVNRPLEMTS